MTKVLVFTSSKRMADDLFELLATDFPEVVGVIHSNKEQNFRFNMVKQFKEGTLKYLIATDIVARGIDVAEVTHVINFDLPQVPENYVHRIGRTGRADKKGIAISFITEKEAAQRTAIESLMKLNIEPKPLPEGLQLSTELTDEEQPKVYMKDLQIKVPKKEERGPSFHPKSAKNSKTNNKVTHKDKMKKKYGKPIKRAGKK
jgi:ATP-dependent RNA helicase RhlE